MVLITYEQKPVINVDADKSRGTRGVNFGLSLHLHPNFV